MAIFDFPTTVRPASVRWALRSNTQAHTSPLSGATQTYELPGARHECTLEFKDLTRAEIATLEAYIFKLRGRANRARLWNHARESARGVATGMPVVRNLKNMFKQSDALENAAWTKSNCTITANAAQDRSGAQTADKIIENTVAAVHFVSQTFSVPDNTVMCVSADLRAAERTWAILEFVTKANVAKTAYFDLINGVVGTVAAGGVASIAAISTGLWRAGFAFSTGAGATTPQARIGIASANNTRSYTGNGASGIYASAAQLETGGPGDVIPTTTATIENLQTGAALRTSGWTPNVNGILLPGDHISLNDRLHMVVDQANSDSWGNATLAIEPPLRSSPTDQTAITTTRASALFMLADDEQVSLDYLRALGSCSLRFVEALV